MENISEKTAAQPFPAIQPFQTLKVLFIGYAHGAHDIYTAFIAPLLPVLIQVFSLTKTEAGLLSIMIQLPSIFQPVVGHISDRVNLKWVVILAPLVTSVFICIIGVMPAYALVAACLLFAGFSNAAFHAIAPVMIGNMSGTKIGSGMSIWMVGGETGRVLGPLAIVAALGWLTFPGLPWLILFGAASSLVLFFVLKNTTSISSQASEGGTIAAALQLMKPLAVPMIFILISRTFMDALITTYLPTMLTDEGATLQTAGQALFFLEAAGVVGIILGGWLSDKIGRKKVILASMIASPVMMLVFLLSQGIWQIPSLIALGFVSILYTPVIMALILEHCAESRALANGVFLAGSFIIRAINVLIIGQIADYADLRTAFYVSIVLVVVAIPFTLLLPGKKRDLKTEIV